jgi:hypothetical protein
MYSTCHFTYRHVPLVRLSISDKTARTPFVLKETLRLRMTGRILIQRFLRGRLPSVFKIKFGRFRVERG